MTGRWEGDEDEGSGEEDFSLPRAVLAAILDLERVPGWSPADLTTYVLSMHPRAPLSGDEAFRVRVEIALVCSGLPLRELQDWLDEHPGADRDDVRAELRRLCCGRP